MSIGNSRFQSFALACCASLSLLAGAAQAQGVRWEDYRGDQNAATDANYNGPAGAPKFTNNPNAVAIANLRTVSANSANAVRTGTSSTISFANGATDALCDNRTNGPAGTGVASTPCRLQAQGKVAYALVQFPAAGTYSIAAAHDDNVVIELSPDFTNTNYRTASYSILAGQVSDWSSSETDFQTFGTFTAANANSCALLRMYWNNQGGLNYNHLRWTTPGGTTQIIPAANLKDPAAVGSSVGCNGSITGNIAGITLNKVIGSPRINAADQFTLQIGTSAAGGTVATATTAGSSTGQQASTSYATTTGTTYYLREVMASGSSSALTAYTAAITCTRNGTAFTPTVVSASNRRWSVVAGATDQIVCTITNTNTSSTTVTVNKVSLGGTGTFSFSGSNGVGSHNIATTSDGVPAAGAAYTLTTAGTQTTITEGAPPAGYALQNIGCTGLGSGGTATPNLSTRTVTLNAAATAGGSAIVCTFTNVKSPILRLQKSLPSGRAVAADQFTLGMNGPNAPTSVTTTGSGSTATGTLTHSSATAGSAYTLSETGAAGANLANYTSTYACTNALSGGQAPSGSGASFSVTPVAGDDLTCTFANTPKTVQFRLAKAWGANAIAGNVASIGATTGLTANTAAFTSTASTASQSAYVTAIAGQTATLPAETFATGNAANYTTTLACDNGVTPSGTNGQQANTVVIPNNLAAGTQVTCTYTNTRRAATLTLRKQWANAAVGDDATLTVSRGAAQLRSFVSDAGSASELDVDATPVNVNAGDVLTLAETLAGGNAGLYDGTLACTGTSGLSGTTLTVAAADTAIVCTWTNARRQADLSIAKTNNVASVVSGTSTTYTVTVTNNGPTAVTGAVLTDTPSPGLTCPAGNIITCSGSGCPASPNPITMGDVSSGLALGTLAATAPGNTVVLTGTCTVD